MKKEIIKLLRDTLQTNGKYDHRKVTTLVSFQFVLIYGMLSLKYQITEFVFNGFILFAGGTIAASIVNKLEVFSRFTKKKDDE